VDGEEFRDLLLLRLLPLLVLSAFAVISYTRNWVYVGFAAPGLWIGAYASLTLLHGAEKSKAARPFRSLPLCSEIRYGDETIRTARRGVYQLDICEAIDDHHLCPGITSPDAGDFDLGIVACNCPLP
jgi:hypothetical protein